MSGSIIICPAEAVPSGILYSGSTWNTALEFSQRWLGAQCRLSPAKLANSMIIFKNNCYHIEIARDSGGNTLTGCSCEAQRQQFHTGTDNKPRSKMSKRKPSSIKGKTLRQILLVAAGQVSQEC